ncbi:hypothetical protein CFAM422_011569 [Trichoderma lentiforme]|uniref:Uncharacterized protein n=1 Tax=Trichoderma lentiforme TaxID=1567552 RepID=A0A9P4X5C7_9HYPO|nr:hypothetical protein CFAM422_011569 [Trichoderma lentiforme]
MTAPVPTYPEYGLPSAGINWPRRQDKRDQVDYSSPNSSEQKARGSAGKTAQHCKEKRGGVGAATTIFGLKV